MDENQLLELKKIYQKRKAGYILSNREKELLRKFVNLSHIEKRSFAEQVNESVDDIETFIEKDIKRQ